MVRGEIQHARREDFNMDGPMNLANTPLANHNETNGSMNLYSRCDDAFNMDGPMNLANKVVRVLGLGKQIDLYEFS